MSRTEARWSLPSPVGICVPSPYHLTLIFCAGKSRLTRSGARHRPFPARVAARRLFLRRGDQALLAHQRRHGVLPHPPARLAQVRGDPRRAVLALVRGKQPPDLGFQPLPARCPRRQPPSGPPVEPGPGHPQRPAGCRVRDAVLLPLGDDKAGHGYRPTASCTQRATERLSTSHLMASSAFSLRSRASSARSSSLSTPSPPWRLRRRSAFTQLPSVPSWMPSSRATCAIGLPVSRTSRTAPSLKSRSNFLRVSPIGKPSSKRISPRWEGKPRTGAAPRVHRDVLQHPERRVS